MSTTNPVNMPPCIVRFQKLRSWKAIRLSAGHTWRVDPVPHADPARRHLNDDWRPVSTPEGLASALSERLTTLTKPPTAGAVLCLEFLITARREAFAENGGVTDAVAYFRDALAWLESRHGAENVIAVNIQNDERAPHLVAYVVPIVKRPERTTRRSVFAPGRDEQGRQRREVKAFVSPPEVALSAWSFYGKPAQAIELQTRFAEEVAARHGLARGLEMSAARHTTNTAHHAAVAAAQAGHIVLSAGDLMRRRVRLRRESLEELAGRVSGLVRERYAPVVASAATADHDRRRARDMVETARRHRARYQAERSAHQTTRAELARLVRGLTPSQRDALAGQAVTMRADNHRRKAAEKARRAAVQREAERQHALEESAKREAAERQRAAEEEAARRLSSITPDELARLPEAERLRCWRLLRERDDLMASFERAYGSGLFDQFGNLTDPGATLAERSPGGDPRTEPGHGAGAAREYWAR